MSQQVHEKFCSKVTKSIAPYLKQIMPYWILAQSDSHSNASKIAKSSFTSTFNEAKQLEVINFTKDEILNVKAKSIKPIYFSLKYILNAITK